MKIESITIYQSRIPLKVPFALSLEALTHAENIIVKICTDLGFTGYGECSPFKTINGESMETAWVVAGYLAKMLTGRDPLQIEACVADMDKVIYGNTSIKSAFDIALHDIASQHAGLPLYAFLGGKNDKEMVTDYTISLGDPAQMAWAAKNIQQKGFQLIKVKVGGSAKTDIERIKQIREAIGPHIPLRLDANQGWNFETAVIVLQALSGYNIQFCEEPIPRWDYMRLKALQNKSPVPLMADESCFDHHDARRLIDLGAVGLFNLKLGKSSGILKATKMIKLAEKAGIKMQTGGFLESRLAFTAAAHLALSSQLIHYYDFDTPLMLEQDPVNGGIIYEKGGIIAVPKQPGLGAVPDPDYLKNLPQKIYSH